MLGKGEGKGEVEGEDGGGDKGRILRKRMIQQSFEEERGA